MERDWNTQTAGVKLEISTHTLTWSVTFRPHFCAKMIQYFNSHAHVERDVNMVKEFEGLPDFNSHAHVERDFHFLLTSLSIILFQLTRSRGA